MSCLLSSIVKAVIVKAVIVASSFEKSIDSGHALCASHAFLKRVFNVAPAPIRFKHTSHTTLSGDKVKTLEVSEFEMARRAKQKTALDVPIISLPGNPIPTKELLVRLSKIADELSAVDQEHVVLDEYRELARNLADPKLIKNKNVGIQAFTACAAADILRLYAPDAPFTEEELSEIFKAFFAQFSHMWDEENPYFLQQSYILKRLVEVRSVVLIGDLPDSQQLVSLLFETMYNLTTKGFPSKLETLASELLAETISESDYIPQDVISLVIKRLNVSSDSQLLGGSSNISNPAFVFSMAICEANSDKMARSVAQLFSEMLDESAKLSDDKGRRGPFKALEKIHSSSVQIWAHVPDLLGSVMGLISDELNSDDEGVRLLATKTIGEMLSSSARIKSGNSAVTFVSYHKDTWANWLKKSSDNSPSVRSTWINQVPDILSLETTSEINSELSQGISKCLIDSSEKVRLSACRAIVGLSFSVLLKKVCNLSILNTLFQLIREKHPEIRNTAINLLADLYNNCMMSKAKDEVVDLGALDQNDYEQVIHKIINGVPNNLLQLNYINDKSITTAVDIVLFERLLPFDDSSSSRVFRLCQFLKELDERSRLAFVAITNRQKKNAEVVLKFLDLAEEYACNSSNENDDKENSPAQTKSKGQIFANEQKIVKWFSSQLPEGINSFDCIDVFFKIRNIRFINLLKNCVNSYSDYKTVKNSAKELLSKLGDAESLKYGKEIAHVSTADLVSNFKILIYRSSTILYNKSNIGDLISLSQDESSGNHLAANDLIALVSANAPGVFKTHVATLANLIKAEDQSSVQVTLLKSLYKILKRFPESFPEELSFLDCIHLLATKGGHLQAKYCVKIIGCSSSKISLVSQVLDSILPLNPESKHFGTHLAALAEIYLIEPSLLASHSSEINTVIVEQVLKKNKLDTPEVNFLNDLAWIEDLSSERYHVLIEKLMAIGLIGNKLRYIASSETTDSETLAAAEKPINLLANIVWNSGEIVKFANDESAVMTPGCFRSRLKLSSGLMLLKLAKYPRLNPIISIGTIKKMTRLIVDERLQVRETFVKSLRKYIQDKTISERFLHLVFFMGHEPDSRLKLDTDTWVMSQHHRSEYRQDTVFERTSVRLIHAIAHDEKFCKLISEDNKESLERQLNGLVYASRYVAMFIDDIANSSNINLLYYLVSRVKQYRDNSVDGSLYDLDELPAEVLNVYRIAELFQLMLKELADSRSWNLQTWPGKINLPSDLYSPMQDYQQAQGFISRVYIPDSIQIELREILSKKPISGVKRRQKESRKPDVVKRNKKAVNQSTKIKKTGGTKTANISKKSSTPSVTRRSNRATTKVFYGESDEDSQTSGSENESEAEIESD